MITDESEECVESVDILRWSLTSQLLEMMIMLVVSRQAYLRPLHLHYIQYSYSQSNNILCSCLQCLKQNYYQICLQSCCFKSFHQRSIVRKSEVVTCKQMITVKLEVARLNNIYFIILFDLRSDERVSKVMSGGGLSWVSRICIITVHCQLRAH